MKKKLLTLFLAVCAATCLSLGLSACGGTEHTLTKTEAKNATCTVDGNVEYWYCSDCGKYFSDENAKTEITQEQTVVKAKGHTEVTDEAVAPTCMGTGLTEGSHCSVCGAVIKAQEVVPALGHSWNDGEITQEATCTEDGVMTYTCTVCKETKTEVIAAGHNWGEISYVWSDDNLTCTATRTCSKCNHVETETATAILSVTTAPTCTGRGDGEYTATFENSAFVTHIKPVTINATGHTFSTEWSSDETNHWHVCENCDATADEAAHTYGEWKYDSTSLKCVRTCSVCDYDDAATAAEVGAVAAIGETCYTTLETAVDAANSGETIVLLDDITITSDVVLLGKNVIVLSDGIVIDVNGHTIDGIVSLTENAKLVTTSGDDSLNGVAYGAYEYSVEDTSITTAQYYLAAYYDEKTVRTYIGSDILYDVKNGEVFADGHAVVITAQDENIKETTNGYTYSADTNLFISYEDNGTTYKAIYNGYNGAEARVFGGWKLPDYNYGIMTTNVDTYIRLDSGKVESLRAASKDYNRGGRDGLAVKSDLWMNEGTIVVNGGYAGIIASGWYYNQSLNKYNVTVSGGYVGAIYGNGQTAYISATQIYDNDGKVTNYVPTVKEANITVTGSAVVEYVYGGGKALTQVTSNIKAQYFMVTEKATIEISGSAKVGVVYGGGFNGPESNWAANDQVAVKEVSITVKDNAELYRVYGGGYNGQWNYLYKVDANGKLSIANYNGTQTDGDDRNIVNKANISIEGGIITELYLGGGSYAVVDSSTAIISGGKIDLVATSGNYGWLKQASLTVSGGVVETLELVHRNYVGGVNADADGKVSGGISVNVTGGKVTNFYAGVSGAFKNSNLTEQTYNIVTLAITGKVEVNFADGTVTNGYLTAGLEYASSVEINGVAVKLIKMNIADESYTGTKSTSGIFVAGLSLTGEQVEGVSWSAKVILPSENVTSGEISFTPPAGYCLTAVDGETDTYTVGLAVAGL